MKKTKKLAALVLAMVMACEESIQPRKPAAPVCPYCGTVTTDMGFVWEGGTRYIKFQCLGCRDFTTRVRY